MITRHVVPAFAFLALTMLFAGCGNQAATEVSVRKASLSELAVAYQGFHDARGRSPDGIDELASFMEENAKPGHELAAESLKRLRDGDIVMYWNAVLNDSAAEKDKYVLGFEAAVPRSGGYVVTGDRNIVLVSPKSFADFKEFPQASGP